MASYGNSFIYSTQYTIIKKQLIHNALKSTSNLLLDSNLSLNNYIVSWKVQYAKGYKVAQEGIINLEGTGERQHTGYETWLL